MLIALAIVSIAMIVTGVILYNKMDNDVISVILGSLGATLFIITIVTTIIFSADLACGRFIDDKIEFYENDNEAVYNEISNIAKAYCDYEKETVDKITELIEQKADPSTILAVLPSLRSSELYAKQMEIYNENRTRIRELQEDKIDLKGDRWWLYFGE